MKAAALVACALLTACATPEPTIVRVPVEVKVPVPVPCKAPDIARPAITSNADALKLTDARLVVLLAAEREALTAYAALAEAALASCR